MGPDLFSEQLAPSDDRRPVLIGMNNPVSSDPRHALYPHPPGCTGHRIFLMLSEACPGVTRSQYMRAFDRRNVVSGATWSAVEARRGADALVQSLQGREAVVLGGAVRAVFGLPPTLIHPVALHGVTWRQIPHPSGRNLWYNDERNKQIVGQLLAELYRSSIGE